MESEMWYRPPLILASRLPSFPRAERLPIVLLSLLPSFPGSRPRINISHYQFPLEKASEQPEGGRASATESIIDFVLCSRAAADGKGKLARCRRREVILAGIS